MRTRFWFTVLSLLGCQAQAPTPTQPSAASSASNDVLPAPPIEAEDRQWRESLLVSDYRGAATAFDLQHPAPTEPGLRFVRARIGSELDEHARVLQLLTDLEQQLPSLSQEVLGLRRAARIATDPDLELARSLSASERVDEQLQGVELFLRMSAFAEASVTCDAVLAKKNLSAARRARARKLHAAAREGQRDLPAAIDDWLWLSQKAPLEEAARGADEEYERASGVMLSKAQRYVRAEAFAGAGRASEAERELERLQTAQGATIAAANVTRTRAWAHYNSRQGYAKAAPLFEAAAKADASYRVQDMFYAARALSRANQDALAIERYATLVKRYPETRFAEEAQFLIARLHQVLGQWQAAVDAATTYLTRYGKSPRFTAQVRHTKALSLLALSKGKDAERELLRLVDDTDKPRDRALLDELRGVALLQQGKTQRAQALFSDVINEQPLSFGALMAAARLRQMAAPVPPPVPVADDVAVPQALPSWELPHKVTFLHGLGLDADAELELERGADAWSARYAPRSDELLCTAYGSLAPAAARYRHAQRVVRERVLQRAIEPATRWLWECIYPQPYPEVALKAASNAQLELALVYAVMRQESAFDPVAGSGVGARGLMQLMPDTARRVAEELGLDPSLQKLDQPSDNLRLGTAYLGKLLRTYNSVPLAAAGYNAGPGALDRWLVEGKTLPLDLFVALIPYKETREYCQRVTGNWARYRYLAGGAEQVPVLELELPARNSSASIGY